jgi:hypothetical protein
MMGSMVGASHRQSERGWISSWPPLAFLVIGFLVLSGISTGNAQDLKPSGSVSIEQVQIAFIGSGNLGGGALQYKGQTVRFKIGGLGIGGFGISKIHATGTIYNLTNLAHFSGPYLQARRGLAIGEMSKGVLWLENGHGVVLGLKAKRTGLALSIGADAIYIKLEK